MFHSTLFFILASWKNEALYYPPYGTFKLSDSHAFQILVVLYGMEEATEIYENRSKVAKSLAKCDVHIVLLIQVSIAVKCVIDNDCKLFYKIFGKHSTALSYLSTLNTYLNQILHHCGAIETQKLTFDFLNRIMTKIKLA